MTEEELKKSKERLMKLWDAYESQEKELAAATARIRDLEEKEKDKNRVIETLRELIDSKDRELRKMEIQRSSLEKERSESNSRLEELTESLNLERSRYRKLFVITQEMEREVERLTKEMEERDRWFRDNMSFFEEFPARVSRRLEMVARPGIMRPKTEDLEPGLKDIAPPKKEETSSVDGFSTKFEKVDPSEETYRELMTVPGITDEKVKTLVEAGYDSLDKLKSASPFELVKLDGITPTLARKISDHVKA